MLMDLKSLTAVQTKKIIETAEHINHFINYSATYPDAITEYRKSGIILHKYSDASHISEPEARSRARLQYFLGPKSNTPIQYMTP